MYLFEYGHALNKIGEYELSNKILLIGTTLSCDPMYWNIIGKNYWGLKDYNLAEQNFKKSHAIIPNRIYPLYLLTKLNYDRGDTCKVKEFGHQAINMIPKIKSVTSDKLQHEINELLLMPQ